MINLALATGFFGSPVQRVTRAPDAYDAVGLAVRGSETSANIVGTIAPASDRHLRDLPEGIREDVTALFWTASQLNIDDRIVHDGVTYRVLHVGDRRIGGFRKAALGRLLL